MVPLGDTGPRHVDGDLPALRGAQELRERAAVVDVGLETVGEGARLAVGQERAPELLGEGVVGEAGHRERLAAVAEGREQADDLAQRGAVGGAAGAEVRTLDLGEAVVPAATLLPQQGGEHLGDKVVDVEQLELHRGVAHGVLAAVGDRVAERRHGGVVVGAAPLAVEVGEAVDEHGRAGSRGVPAEEPLPRQLGLAVCRAGVAPREARLRGAREHDRARVAVALERSNEVAREPEVARHELRRVLGAVHAREVEHEVGTGAHRVQLLRRGLDVALHDLEGQEGLEPLAAVLAVANRLQRLAKVAADEPFGTGYQDAHHCTASCSRPSRASCTYSAVLIFSTVPATSSRSVLWEV